MEALATIGKRSELARQSSEEKTLALASCKPLPAQSLAQLGTWMAETQSAKPNQELAPGTADMYLAEWQEMASTMGMEAFRLGLLRAIRESDFFPAPDFIRERCIAEIHRMRGENYLEDLKEMRAQWERDKGKETYLTPEEHAAKMRIEAKLAAVRAKRNPETEGDAA